MEKISLDQFRNQIINSFEYYYPDRNTLDVYKDDLLDETFINSPGVVFLCDFPSKSYSFISDNVRHILGITPEEFLEGGITVGLSLYPSHQFEMMVKNIMPKMFQTFYEYGLMGKAKDIRVSYSSLVKCPDNTFRWYLQQVTVIETDENNMPVKALKMLTDIHDFKTGSLLDFFISERNEKGIYDKIFSEQYSTLEPEILLSNRELEVLQLVSNGLSSKQIAGELNISENTVNNHKKNMINRSGISSISELMKKTLFLGMIS